MRFLRDSDRLQGRILDYGCGRGFCAESLGLEKYDPYWFPDYPQGYFDTITCHYVLNVIEAEVERLQVLEDIMSLLAPGGIAYVSVRRDKQCLRGRLKNGAFQGFVTLGTPWQSLLRTAGVEIYQRSVLDSL